MLRSTLRTLPAASKTTTRQLAARTVARPLVAYNIQRLQSSMAATNDHFQEEYENEQQVQQTVNNKSNNSIPLNGKFVLTFVSRREDIN